MEQLPNVSLGPKNKFKKQCLYYTIICILKGFLKIPERMFAFLYKFSLEDFNKKLITLFSFKEVNCVARRQEEKGNFLLYTSLYLLSFQWYKHIIYSRNE